MRTKYAIECLLLFSLVKLAYQVSYLVSMPKYMQPGTLYKVNLNLMNSKTTKLSMELILNRATITSLQKTVRGGHLTELALKVPNTLKHGSYQVKLTGTGGTSFVQNTYVKCIGNEPIILVQLDRGLYAENEKVQNRIIVLHPSLRPFSGDISIEVMDSKGRLIYQFLNNTLSKGVFDKTFRIPSSPNLGTWKIHVEAERETYEKYFVVRKYIVPNFYVSISCNKNSLERSTRSLKCTVKTRHNNGKILKGTYRFQALTKRGNRDEFLKNTYGDITGNKEFTISWNRASDVTDDITVIAQVGDNTTGTTVSSQRTIMYKKDSTTTWELEPQFHFFQPGLPLRFFVKFSSAQSSSLEFEITYRRRRVRTCKIASPTYKYRTEWENTEKERVSPDGNGYGTLNLQPDSEVYELVLAAYQGRSKKKFTLTAALSSKGKYISIIPHQGYAKVGKNLHVTMQSTVNLNKVIFYQIVSRGQLIRSGQINGQSKMTQQVSFSVRGEWYPRATLIITYVSNDSVVMVDSKDFEVIGNPFINKVTIRSDKSSAGPKEKVRFDIDALNNSTVYLMSIDKGIHSSQEGFDIDIDDIYGGITQFTQYQQSRTKKVINKIQGPQRVFEDIGFTFSGHGSLQVPLPNVISFPTKCKNPCSPNPCNQGKCSARSNGRYLCSCSAGFYGNRCEKQRMPTGFKRPSFAVFPFSTRRSRLYRPNIIQSVAPPSIDRNKTPLETYLQPDIGFGLGVKKLSHFKASEKRLYFPKTWIWDSIFICKSNKAIYEAHLPDSITSWVTTGFSVHDSAGIGIIHPVHEIRVLKDFYIDIVLPTSASVGSSMAVRVSMYNYLGRKLHVLLLLYFGTERASVSSTVPADESNSAYMDVKIPDEMHGYKTITVVAYDFFGFRSLDYVQKDVLVKPPGIEQEYNVPCMVSLNSNEHFSKSVQLTYPRTTINGTSRVYITVTGDVLSQSIQGLESLIRLPCGCGEQTMMYLAPNIYVLNYLHATKQLQDDFERKALSFISKGIDRQLGWKRHDGSFSVWGNRDREGSTWLTAFVLTCFHQARQYIYIKESIFEDALRWLIRTQNTDGSFPVGRRVIHYDMKGGVHASRVTLAAYVLLTLIENDDIPNLEHTTRKARNRVIKYIRSQRHSLYRNKHGLALTAYALQKSGRSAEARELYKKLEKLAQKKDGFLYWTYNSRRKWKASNLFSKNPNRRASPIEIETTSYALLYLTQKGNLGKGVMIMKWLVSQKNPTGGFSSTQDTVVSLYALSEFTAMKESRNRIKSNLTLTVTPKDQFGTALGSANFTVNSTNRLLVQQSQEFDSKTQKIEINGKGSGFAIVDVVVKYNVETVLSDASFKVSTRVIKRKQTFDFITVNVCVRRKGRNKKGMVVVEVGIPSGFKGDLSKTAKNNPRHLKHVESGFDKVVLYYGKIETTNTCFDVTASRVDKVTQSQAMPIVVYDYYEPENQGMTNYTSGILDQMSLCDICTECGVCRKAVLG